MSTNYDNRVLRELIKNTPGHLDEWLRSVSGEIEQEIHESINYQGPSQPGFPPGYDSKDLMNGLDSEKLGDLSYVVFVIEEYGPYLELGTEKMVKRPFFTPVFEEWRRRKFIASALATGLIRP